MTAPAPLCKHAWLDAVALHATPRTPKAHRLSETELAFAIRLKSIIRDGVAVVTAETMAHETGIPHRTVRRYFQAFAAWRFITLERSSGGYRGHRIALLDATAAMVDRNWSKTETRPAMSGRVGDDATRPLMAGQDGEPKDGAINEQTRPSMGGQDTRPLHAGARTNTLTLPAGPAPKAGPDGVPNEDASVPTSDEEKTVLGDRAPDAGWRPAGAIPTVDGQTLSSVGEAELSLADARGASVSVEPSPSIGADEIDVDELDEEEDEAPSYEDRVGELRDLVRQMVDENIPTPSVLVEWLDDDHDLADDELDELEEIAERAFDDHREGVDARNAEIEAAKIAVAASQAAELARRVEVQEAGWNRLDDDEREALLTRVRQGDETHQIVVPSRPAADLVRHDVYRAVWIGSVANKVATLSREDRWHAGQRFRRQYTEKLKATLPVFLATSLADRLVSDMLDEVANREWRAGLDTTDLTVAARTNRSITQSPSRLTQRSEALV